MRQCDFCGCDIVSTQERRAGDQHLCSDACKGAISDFGVSLDALVEQRARAVEPEVPAVAVGAVA